MSVRIRLKRTGSKKRPFYRVVVTDSRAARDSRSIEDLGYYNPLEDPVVVNVDRDRVSYWTGKGALCSSTVATLLKVENSTHPTRRRTLEFVEPTPEPVKTKKKKETKAEKVEAATAEETPVEAAAETAAPEASSEGEAAAVEAVVEAKEETAAAPEVEEVKEETAVETAAPAAEASPEEASTEEAPAEKAAEPKASAEKTDDSTSG